MADAVCGPSNALSTFQKHSSVDRTLQQDRLASQRNHEQGFRSAPGPSAGTLDAEFEAFQASQLPQLHDAYQDHFAHGPSQSFQPSQSQLSGWASDFQNMNLNDVQQSPVPSSSQLRQFAPPHPNTAAQWYQDFMQPGEGQQQQIPERLTQYNSWMDTAGRFRGVDSQSPYHYRTNVPLQSGTQDQNTSTREAQIQDPSLEFDDALFEKHFEAAALEMDQTMGQAEAGLNSKSGETFEEAKHSQAFDNTSLLGPSILKDTVKGEMVDAGLYDPIGSDTIPSEGKGKGKGKERKAPDDADELARTAGNLLENVKHEQNDKFKKSSFLSLMRQLRDREVGVEGDKLVDIQTTQPLHPGGEGYPPAQEYSFSRPTTETQAQQLTD